MSAQFGKITWIAVDWGTSRLRAWGMSASGDVLAEAASSDGMAGLTPAEFEAALLSLIEPWLGSGTMPVMACGMVGARQGWFEAPYRATPCQARTDASIIAHSSDPRIAVRIIPGIMQGQPADVMRGEETQIVGYLARNPGFDGVLCLPGTHTKWVHVSADEIVSFRTFMTGEMFALLTQSSVLRHSIASEGWDEQAFSAALDEAMSRPEQLAARLFSLRAEHLLQNQSDTTARAKLSGFLIGAELAAAKPYWLGQQIALIGDQALLDLYAQALRQQGTNADRADGSEMTIAGLTAAQDAPTLDK